MRKSFKVLIAVVLVLATCCVTAAAYTKNSKNVTLSLYGSEEMRSTYANTVSEFLEENKITQEKKYQNPKSNQKLKKQIQSKFLHNNQKLKKKHIQSKFLQDNQKLKKDIQIKILHKNFVLQKNVFYSV